VCVCVSQEVHVYWFMRLKILVFFYFSEFQSEQKSCGKVCPLKMNLEDLCEATSSSFDCLLNMLDDGNWVFLLFSVQATCAFLPVNSKLLKAKHQRTLTYEYCMFLLF